MEDLTFIYETLIKVTRPLSRPGPAYSFRNVQNEKTNPLDCLHDPYSTNKILDLDLVEIAEVPGFKVGEFIVGASSGCTSPSSLYFVIAYSRPHFRRFSVAPTMPSSPRVCRGRREEMNRLLRRCTVVP